MLALWVRLMRMLMLQILLLMLMVLLIWFQLLLNMTLLAMRLLRMFIINHMHGCSWCLLIGFQPLSNHIFVLPGKRRCRKGLASSGLHIRHGGSNGSVAEWELYLNLGRTLSPHGVSKFRPPLP